MIERYDPFGQMLSLRQMMDRLMEEAFVMPRGPAEQPPGAAGPAMNVYEEGDKLVVETQLPGVKPEDIDVNIEHGTLTIRGQIRAEQERRERNYLVREHRSGTFSRTLRLPETVDPDACQATYENGVLRLTLPKSEAAKPRRIAITSGSQVAGQSGGRESLSSGGVGASGAGGTSVAGGRGESGGARRGTSAGRSARPRGAKASGGGTGKGTASTGARQRGTKSRKTSSPGS